MGKKNIIYMNTLGHLRGRITMCLMHKYRHNFI